MKSDPDHPLEQFLRWWEQRLEEKIRRVVQEVVREAVREAMREVLQKSHREEHLRDDGQQGKKIAKEKEREKETTEVPSPEEDKREPYRQSVEVPESTPALVLTLNERIAFQNRLFRGDRKNMEAFLMRLRKARDAEEILRILQEGMQEYGWGPERYEELELLYEWAGQVTGVTLPPFDETLGRE